MREQEVDPAHCHEPRPFGGRPRAVRGRSRDGLPVDAHPSESTPLEGVGGRIPKVSADDRGVFDELREAVGTPLAAGGRWALQRPAVHLRIADRRSGNLPPVGSRTGRGPRICGPELGPLCLASHAGGHPPSAREDADLCTVPDPGPDEDPGDNPDDGTGADGSDSGDSPTTDGAGCSMSAGGQTWTWLWMLVLPALGPITRRAGCPRNWSPAKHDHLSRRDEVVVVRGGRRRRHGPSRVATHGPPRPTHGPLETPPPAESAKP